MNYFRDGLTTILQVHLESFLVAVTGCIFCILLWKRARRAAIWGLLGFLSYIGSALVNTAGAELFAANHARGTLGESFFYVFVGFTRGFTLLFLLLAILANRKASAATAPPVPQY